jgi:ribosomal protein L11 methyltransferase
MGADPAVRVSVPARWAEIVGAALFDLLGAFQEIDAHETRHLVFYPFRNGPGFVPDEEILAALPPAAGLRDSIDIERVLVPGGWEEGWKSHFRPLEVGRLNIRPPWEPAVARPQIDLVLTPGLAFGTGLHATTRSMLRLLQAGSRSGPLLDAGTGSGILAIAGALLGFSPVRAFDNDPLAVEAARSNVADNGALVEVVAASIEEAPLEWFDGRTVVANMTLDPVLVLLERLGYSSAKVRRLLVAGILAGKVQEDEVLRAALRAGFRPVCRVFEKEWVSLAFEGSDPSGLR